MGRIVKIGNIEIRIVANDHAPAHFHVITPYHEAKFALADLALIDGAITPAIRRRIWNWIVERKAEIAAEWSHLPPTSPPERRPWPSCPVSNL